ncbi:MAG: nitroreductase family protein [Promethearchaeota archaeon]
MVLILHYNYLIFLTSANLLRNHSEKIYIHKNTYFLNMEIQISNFLELIKSRKSVRNFIFKKLTQQAIKEILECGFALDENINQPYRVNVVTHPTVKMMLAEIMTQYADIYETASCYLVVFLDLGRSVNRESDILAIGAFVENILLAVHAMPDLGAVWLRIDTDKKEKINQIFKLSDEKYELMGVIAIGAINEEIESHKSGRQGKKRSVEGFTDWF